MALKRCSVCGVEKDVQDFFKHKGGKHGVAGSCKICRTEAIKKYFLEHPENRRETTKKNRDTHKENIKEAAKIYRLTHKAEQTAYSKKYAIDHPERGRERVKRYYKRHPDRVRKLKEKWIGANPEKYRVLLRQGNAKRRALKKATNNCAGADMELLRLIYLYCPKGFHVDHIIPLSKGGVHHPNNLQYLPALINAQKHNNVAFDCSSFIVRWQSLIEEKGVKYGT
jgi:hypothetical protein